MGRVPERVAFQFTFLFRRDGSRWSALACEVDVASCGKTLREAREALQDAVELYVSYMVENGMRDRIARRVPQEEVAAFLAAAKTRPTIERHTMIAVLHPASPRGEMEAEFIPTELQSADCQLPSAVLVA